ncbi:hypothetical protein VV11_012975 [Trichodesmium erythraeum 21-75]|nr:hypothetical protein [Trichodesmium erythraeum 21-75]
MVKNYLIRDFCRELRKRSPTFAGIFSNIEAKVAIFFWVPTSMLKLLFDLQFTRSKHLKCN